MIMDDGSLAEMDAPQALLALPNGVFRSLWEKHQRQHGGISRTGSTGHNLANKE